MGLLEEWRDSVCNENLTDAQVQQFWADYFLKEKKVYEEILKTPDEPVSGTVEELAKRFGITPHEMAGFLDGINDSLKEKNDVENLEKDTEVQLGYDSELLYRNMVEAKADWLYNLPEWDPIFSEEKRKELYKAQKSSHTIVKGKKIGRNDPCPCGSGKKYKHCCGR